MASKLFVDELEPTESSELTITSLSNSSMPTGSVLRVFHKLYLSFPNLEISYSVGLKESPHQRKIK